MIALPGEAGLSAALQLAPERGELILLYQPKVDLATGRLAAVEALLRWHSRDYGEIEPSTFIPVAERCGAIDTLTEWGLCRALRQWVDWREQGLSTCLAFNISALTLRDPAFPDFVHRLCQIEGVPTDHLTIEVTESATQHVIRLLDAITRFRIKGMGVALDDFGTGYSSLLQLKQLPFTELKIDRCFIADAVRDADSRLIVKSLVDLAHGLSLTATAEGIEDEATLDLLVKLGCDHAQGFLFAEPMRGPALAPWLLDRGVAWRERLSPPLRSLEAAA
jgi:EAL domain-containing protein (putative c-di-GMP-specific phosphodiesterase class I)